MHEPRLPPQWRRNAQAYIKYSGMVFELLALLLISYWIGQYIDRIAHTSKPYWTAAVILFFFITWLIRMYYQLLKK